MNAPSSQLEDFVPPRCGPCISRRASCYLCTNKLVLQGGSGSHCGEGGSKLLCGLITSTLHQHRLIRAIGQHYHHTGWASGSNNRWHVSTNEEAKYSSVSSMTKVSQKYHRGDYYSTWATPRLVSSLWFLLLLHFNAAMLWYGLYSAI